METEFGSEGKESVLLPSERRGASSLDRAWAGQSCLGLVGRRLLAGRAQPTGAVHSPLVPSWLAASAAALLLTEGAVSTRLFLTSCSGLRVKLQGFCKRRSISKPNWTKAQREKRPDFILLSSFYFYFPGIGNGLRRGQQQNGANWYFHYKQGQGSIPGLQLSSYVPQTNLFFFFLMPWFAHLKSKNNYTFLIELWWELNEMTHLKNLKCSQQICINIFASQPICICYHQMGRVLFLKNTDLWGKKW